VKLTVLPITIGLSGTTHPSGGGYVAARVGGAALIMHNAQRLTGVEDVHVSCGFSLKRNVYFVVGVIR